MAYDPGALNASLAAAVGSDSALMAELRLAFIESAERQLDLMGRARCYANWIIAASRLKSLAASFGASGLGALADEALDGAPSDPVVLKKIAVAIGEFGEAPLDDPFQLTWEIGAEIGQRSRRRFDDGSKDARTALALERTAAGGHFVQHDAQREDVGS